MTPAGVIIPPMPRPRTNVATLQDIPNIGPAIAGDLRILDITTPADLVGRDPYRMYDDLNRLTNARHDPCVLDTFIAATRYMNGAPARPWHAYTHERKRTLAARAKLPRV
jgi:hypothetical protein